MLSAGASFDSTRTYRYRLWRRWDLGPGLVWIMLNPSTADENVLDPTLRRCRGYSQAFGFGGMEILNLYALRSTDPKGLWLVDDPVGPLNDAYILETCALAPFVMVGWGTNAKRERVDAVVQLLDGVDLRCLKTTEAGHPSHPLYLKKTLRPIPWRPPA